MGWSGGTFSRVHNFSADASAGIQAQASRFDAEFDEYKAGLENCVTRDGQNAASGDLPMGGNKHTGVGAANSAAEYLRADQATQQTGIYVVGAVSGHTFSASVDVFPAALTDGMRIVAKASGASLAHGSVSASAATIIVNGLTAEVYNRNDAWTPNQFFINVLGGVREFVYSSASGRWMATEQTFVTASTNAVFAAWNNSASNYEATASVVAYFARQGDLKSFVTQATASLSVSTSAQQIELVGGFPNWAAPQTRSLLQAPLGQIVVRQSSSGSVHTCSFMYDEGSDLWTIRPIDGAVLSGPGLSLAPFNLTYK